MVGRQCRLRGELRSMFYFLGAKVTTQRITRHDRRCEQHSLLAHRHNDQVLLASLLPLLYQVSFLFCFALFLSNFGNTHRGAEPTCSSSFTPQSIAPTRSSSGDLKCLNLPISPRHPSDAVLPHLWRRWSAPPVPTCGQMVSL